MKYPGLKSIYSRGPVKIAKGVSTIGFIDCPLFFTDTGEQASCDESIKAFNEAYAGKYFDIAVGQKISLNNE